MSDLIGEFKRTLTPFLNLNVIFQFKKSYKIKLWYFLIFFIFLFIFGFISGFLSSGYKLTGELLSAPVFASVFGAFILAIGYNKGQGKLEMLKVSEKKIEAIAKFTTAKEEEMRDVITEIIRYFSLNSVVSLHNFLMMKNSGNMDESSMKALLFNMNAEVFTMPSQGKLLKYRIHDKPIISQIYWLLSAKKEEVLRYAVLHTPIFTSQTDTIPGIFCKLQDISSARKIFSIKKRDSKKPLAIYTSKPSEFVSLNPVLNMFLEGMKDIPFTLVAPPSPKVPKFCLKNGFAGVRILSPNSKMLQFLSQNNLTLLGTSANFSGEDSPNSISEVSPEITSVAPVLNLEEKGYILASSVIKFDGNKIIFLRQGAYIREILTWIHQNGGTQVQSFEDGEEKISYIINLNKNEE
jgi:tRNA A37 threonylcarbamoyladenosine synthetase subunit TsaC/SUA5/YrdC